MDPIKFGYEGNINPFMHARQEIFEASCMDF